MKKLIFFAAILIAIAFNAANSNAQTSRGLGVPFPNTTDSTEREVNKLVAIADTGSDCGDVRAYEKQITYIVNSGGSITLGRGGSHVNKATAAITELNRSLGGCGQAKSEASEDVILFLI